MHLTYKLTQFKTFCARVWALSAPYFRSEDKWKARGLLVAKKRITLPDVGLFSDGTAVKTGTSRSMK